MLVFDKSRRAGCSLDKEQQEIGLHSHAGVGVVVGMGEEGSDGIVDQGS